MRAIAVSPFGYGFDMTADPASEVPAYVKLCEDSDRPWRILADEEAFPLVEQALQYNPTANITLQRL